MSEKKTFEISNYYPLFFTVILVVILFQYPFAQFEAFFYDLRIRSDLGIRESEDIVLITMDEESDEYLGERYPFTYASQERLLSRIIQDNPHVIGYLVDFQEPDSVIDRKNYTKFIETIKRFKGMGGAFRMGLSMDDWGIQKPPDGIANEGSSIAIINQDSNAFSRDDVTRRVILNISGEDTFHLWMANEFRKREGLLPFEAKSFLGSYYLSEADATFSLFRYFVNPQVKEERIPRISFHRALVGNFPKGYFTNKVVLIGPSYISNSSDFIYTPYNKEDVYKTSKLSVHSAMIESLIQNKTVLQIPRGISHAISLLMAMFLSFIISKVRPTRGLLITFCMFIGVIIFSYILFSFMGLWLYIVHIVLSIFIVYYIWVPYRAIIEYQNRYAIQEETKLLKKVDNLKQNFISLMSHDLKTPVAKIAGIADNLKHKLRGNEDVQIDLTRIVDSTKELNRFITSILDLTKIESRNLNLSMSSKDVNKIIEEIVSRLSYEANEKNIRIETKLDPLYPIKLDINLINRVISNLVENAIKYSGEGSVINVESTDDEDWVYISISDNGVGIADQDLEHIFDKFYRVKNDASHKIKGTGLGLYLVKYFVELHGGSIIADSKIGEGTTFKIMLKNV